MSMLAETHPINWFEIPTADLERAMKFYGAIFDIEMQPLDLGDLRFGFFPMQEGATGATGALVHHAQYAPSHEGTLIYFAVQDIDAVLARIEANGGATLRARQAVGDFGFVAFFQDSEGNRVALHARS